MSDDGIALRAAAHPIAPWYKRLWFRLRHRNRINPSALKTYYIESREKSDD